MKPGTFTQMYVQLIFAVQNRKALLTKEIRPRVFEYISGIITQMDHKSIIVNGVSDHIHIFIGLNPKISVSDTVHDIKRSSSIFIKNENLSRFKFTWQEGYGSFTYSQSHIERVYKYIENQEKHHQKTTFKSEYINFLDRYQIEYDKRFLFDFFN